MTITGFDAVSAPDAHSLILGTMPGEKSLRAGEYYAHPRNAFWRIMGELYGFAHDAQYQIRLESLTSNGVALWDVLGACERTGSLDSNIKMKSAKPNNLQLFLTEHPGITRIFFNGKKAADLFGRLVLPKLPPKSGMPGILIMPSTSPANAHLSYKDKFLQWKRIKSVSRLSYVY